MSTVPAVNPVAPVATGAQNAFPIHPSGSLYVGDLASDVTEAILFEVFSRAGAVSSIRVCRDATTRRSLGYAYVNFHSVQDAERALDTLNYSTIKDRPCRIMWSHRDPSVRKNSNSNVFIKNLAPEIDSKQLYDTFSKFGNILSCKIATDPMSGQSRGFGYVHFETEVSAAKAIEEVNGHTLASKQVYVGLFERRTERNVASSKFTNVYVKNIPREWDEKKLTAEFSRFGNVTSVALRQASGDKLKDYCFGFVNFATHEEAAKAVEGGNQLEYAGVRLYCDRFQKRGERMSLLTKMHDDRRRERVEKYKDRNLYVKNLEDDVNENKLRDMFKTFGNITSVALMKDDKGTSRGFGFVCFENPADASKALNEMNNKTFEGGVKPLYVNFAQRKEDRRVQLEHAFMAGSRMQPMAMFFPPNMPMQQYMMQQPFRRMQPQPAPQAMRGYPSPGYFPPSAGMARGRGGRGGAQNQSGRPYPQGMQQSQPHMRTAPRQMRPVQQQPQQRGQYGQQPPFGNQELSASTLASASPEVQKQMLGERLYPLVYQENPKQAAKITGMFLEMETSECLQLLESPQELKSKVAEAMRVLEQADAQ